MNKIVSITVTYNRKKLLKENIEALLKQDYSNFDIIVIDNNSSDGTDELMNLYSNNERVKYINTGENLGGAGGFNFGIKKAIELGYKYAWIMDDDTIPNINALSKLMEKKDMLNDDFSYLCSLVKWTDGKLCIMNKQEISEDALEEYENLKNNIIKVNYASFVSCFIDLDISRKIGLPIKEFFIYGDDMEYTLRLGNQKPGYLIIDSQVIHKMGQNNGINVIDVEPERIQRYYYNFRNVLYINRKKGKKEFMINIIRNMYLVLKILFKSKNKKIKRICAVLKGTMSGLFFRPNIEIIE